MRRQALDVQSRAKRELIDVSAEVRRFVSEAGVRDGLLQLFVPHTTAAVTINENADPDVRDDIGEFLRRLVPDSDWFRHAEGNSAAHVLSTLVGVSLTVAVVEGRPCLGTWQGFYFCEFDGPRRRQLLLTLLPG